MSEAGDEKATAREGDGVVPGPGRGSVWAIGCLWAAAAIAQLVIGVRESLQGTAADPAHGLFVFGMGGLVVVTLAFGLSWVCVEKLQGRALARRYPDEPWKWKRDWVAGAVRDGGSVGAVFTWVLVIDWTVITLPMAIGEIRENAATNKAVPPFTLLFGVIAAALLALAVYFTVQWRKFGQSVFTPQALPFSPGGDVVGTIRIPTRFVAAGGVELRLACINMRVVGTGKRSRVVETVRWERKKRAKASPTHRGDGMEVPVRFALPGDVPVTRSIGPDDDDHWFLDAAASVPGADYAARFELPVFVVPHARR